MDTLLSDSQNASKRNSSERPAGLEIVLLKRTYVLPWNQFIYAEGGDDEIRIAFTTHDVLVRGNRLGYLLAELAAQRITRLQQPARPDRFGEGSGSSILELDVVKVQASRYDA